MKFWKPCFIVFLCSSFFAGCESSKESPRSAEETIEKSAAESVFGEPIRMLSWNVESDGSDPKVIAEQLSRMNEGDKYAIIGLTEVLPNEFDNFQSALGKNYKYVFSKTGKSDRMQVLYNKKLFEKIRQLDLDEINPRTRYRSPLVVHLRHRESAKELMVMLNHLARGKAEIRQQQAKDLVEWARDETLPIVAIGDYNFDYVFETETGNLAFANMMGDGIWKWIQPEEMIDTNWYDQITPDGKDDYPGSMLDFAFATNAASQWPIVCNVIVRPNDFPDDESTSDHRPLELLVK